ncbi:MAG TPA: hypothetical protein EYN67_01340 [Flavobacteriales bacterium]|nr:hypothetical protein [Flavobacteriales bacterium]
MTSQYKIILVSDLEGVLSDKGKGLLLTSRYNKDKTKIIHCINHPVSTIAATFKEGFDFNTFLSSTKTYSHKEALEEMKTIDWRNEEDDS